MIWNQPEDLFHFTIIWIDLPLFLFFQLLLPELSLIREEYLGNNSKVIKVRK